MFRRLIFILPLIFIAHFCFAINVTYYINITNSPPGESDTDALNRVRYEARWGVFTTDVVSLTKIHTDTVEVPQDSDYIFKFSEVEDYYEPALTNVSVGASNIGRTNYYRAFSNAISITTESAAVWTISGPDDFTNSSGYITGGTGSKDIMPVPTGSYTIVFSDITGYATPATVTTNLTDACPVTNTIDGSYSAYTSAINVTVNGYPDGNAAWSVEGPEGFEDSVNYAAGYTNSVLIEDVPDGNYTFSWPGVTGYTTPTNTTLTVSGSPLINDVSATWVLAYPTNIPSGSGIQKFYQPSYFLTNLYLHDSGVALHDRLDTFLTDAGVTNITSDDSSVEITDAGGPTTDLSVTNYVMGRGFLTNAPVDSVFGETGAITAAYEHYSSFYSLIRHLGTNYAGTNVFTGDGITRTATGFEFTNTDTGATNITAGATDSYDAGTRTLTWNTNAASGADADLSGWSGYSATQLINRVTTSSIPSLTSLVADFSDTASGAGWTFDENYAYAVFSYPSASGETISFTMTGLFHSATSAVPDGTISGIEFCQENGSSGWYFTPDNAEGSDIEGAVTVGVWYVCGSVTSDVQTVSTNGTFGSGGTVLNCGPFGSSNDLWGADLSGVSVSDISNTTFHVEMSLYPTATNGEVNFFIGPWLDKIIPETRFWFYEDTTHTFGIDDDGIFRIDDSPALTNMTFGMTDSTAYRGDWGLAVSNIAVAGSNLAYSASTNAEAARTIATNADAAAGVAYSAATNAQAVAEEARQIGTNAQAVADAALPKAGGTMTDNIAMGGHDITGAGTITTTNLAITGGATTNGQIWVTTNATGQGELVELPKIYAASDDPQVYPSGVYSNLYFGAAEQKTLTGDWDGMYWYPRRIGWITVNLYVTWKNAASNRFYMALVKSGSTVAGDYRWISGVGPTMITTFEDYCADTNSYYYIRTYNYFPEQRTNDYMKFIGRMNP